MEGPKREPMSPVDFFEREVLPRLDVEKVFAGVDFKSKGSRYWRGPCPLHKGDNPSAFSVDVETLRWTCFSHCGSGSALDFMEWRGGRPNLRSRDYVEAVKRAAAFAGVDASAIEREFSPEEEERHAKRESWQRLLDTFFAHAHAALEGTPAEHIAGRYLAGRGFPSGALRQDFGLYTSPADVKECLLAASFSEDEVDGSGLLSRDWAGRLVIPWRDRWGRLVTFAARDLTGEAERKYLYPFGSSKPLAFGLDVALRSPEVHREGLVLVEGLFDVLLLHARGFRHVAGIGGNGKELTRDKWETLAEGGVRTVTLALDRDAAGREGTLAALENADKAANAPVVYVVDPEDLAPYKDPDALVREKGADFFRELLKRSLPGALYRGRQALRGVRPDSSERERREAVEHLVALVDSLSGPRAALDRQDLLHLAEEATGYPADEVEGMAEALATVRRKKEAEEKAAAALRDAEAARSKGDLGKLRRSLREALDSIESEAAEEPPAFSVERLERESRELPGGKRSRWSALDRLGVAFNPGELALVAARTGHGKTSFLVGLLKNWLEDPEDKGLLLFYSLEEPEVRVFHRLLVLLAYSGDPRGDWTANEVRDFLRDPNSRESWPDSKRLEAARERLCLWEDRLLVVDRPAWNVDRVAAHARELADRRPVSAVLVDYLQRLGAPEGSFDRRDIELSAMARRLRALALDLSALVVAGVQINREAAKASEIPRERKDRRGTKYELGYSHEEVQEALRARRPKLHQLSEGGSEQEGDLVLGLMNYRADFEEEAEGPGTVPDITRLEVGALKSRHGDVGRWASLAFVGRLHVIRDPHGREIEP